MTSLKFERPVGAKADLAELKYISALHQTSDLRLDGSIDQSDISSLLASKFGISICEDDVQDFILRGLSTSSSEGRATGKFDLCEVVAALIIPELLQAAEQNNGAGYARLDSAVEIVTEEGDLPQDMINIFLRNIYKAAFGSEAPEQDYLVINSENMKKILLAFGEVELSQNQNHVANMVKLAKGSSSDKEGTNDGSALNVETLIQALTSDLQAYTEITSSDLTVLEKSSPFQLCNRRSQVSTDDRNEDASLQNEDVEDVEEGSMPITGNEESQSSGKEKTHSQGELADEMNATQAKRIFTAESIDFSADAQASRCVAVCLWLLVINTILYSGGITMSGFSSLLPPEGVCHETAVWCDTLNSVMAWIDSIVLITLVGGLFIMGIGSLGNKVGASRIAVLSSIIPAVYFFVRPFTPIEDASSTEGSAGAHGTFALIAIMAISVVVIIVRVGQLAYLSTASKRWLGFASNILERGFTGSEFERLEAASHKVSRMLHNACDISRDSDTLDGGIVSFHESQDAVEKVGGHRWVWKRMKDESLYRVEGIRFSARLVAANIMQFFTIIYITLYMKETVENWIEAYEGNFLIVIVRSTQSAATNMVPQLKNLSGVALKVLDGMYQSLFPALEKFRQNTCEAINASNQTTSFDVQEICSSASSYLSTLQQENEGFKTLILAAVSTKLDPIQNFLTSAIDTAADWLANVVVVVDPFETWNIQMAAGIGGLVAFCAAIYLATLYLPSVTSTTLRFRSGVFPSLAAPDQFTNHYRVDMHYITFITGSIFWGTLIYVAGIAFLISFIILAVIWLVKVLPAFTGDETSGIAGWLLGSIITFVAQFAIFSVCTCSMYRAYYRRKPGWTNIHSLLWEAAWIGMSVMFVVMRALKLTMVALLQIGRIDIPFLSPGVGEYFGFKLDNIPHIFRRDILAHEAHNHPFIERLSKIYLLKIQHHNDFANSAGTTWRLLLVVSLLPWLRKFRVDAKSCGVENSCEEEIAQRTKFFAKADKTALQEEEGMVVQ